MTGPGRELHLDRAGMKHASYIGLMETYKNIPKLSTIERIAEALNVPVLELFTPHDPATGTSHPETGPKAEEKKQKIREHLKKEILSKLENDLDDVLQII